MKKAKKSVQAVIYLVCFIAFSSQADEDANAILEQIRSAQAQIQRPLSGQLRPENGNPVPFQLRLSGQEEQFEFFDPPETLVLQLNETGSVLSDRSSTGRRIVSGAKMNQPVRGTDVTYGDLSLRFLYWTKAKYEGEQRVRTVTCSVVLVQAANRNPDYSSVRLWIAKDRAAMIKAEAFDAQGRPVKRFEVISAQEIEGKTIFKQIRIERLDPQSEKVISRTYLELDRAEGG